MCTRLLLLIVTCLGLFSSSKADDGIKARKARYPTKQASPIKPANAAVSLPSMRQGNALSGILLAINEKNDNGSKLNPRAISFVQDYIAKNGDDLQEIKSWCKPYFNLMDGILAQYGLPVELKYLAVIESELKASCVSGVGAAGPWQLMPETAKILGLKVTRKYDERKNYAMSTRAAALYLRDLYGELGDWLLVIAAYNAGTANVCKAIRKAHSRDFWYLQYYLPAESRNHVKKFIATQYAFEGQGGVTTLTTAEANEQLSGSSMYVFSRKLTKAEIANTKTISVCGKYCAPVIAKYTLMDVTAFNRYNPGFDMVMASSNNTYEMKLPDDKADLFFANKYDILNESVKALIREASASQILSENSHDLAKKED